MLNIRYVQVIKILLSRVFPKMHHLQVIYVPRLKPATDCEIILKSCATCDMKGKVQPCTGTEALYRPYGPYGE